MYGPKRKKKPQRSPPLHILASGTNCRGSKLFICSKVVEHWTEFNSKLAPKALLNIRNSWRCEVHLIMRLQLNYGVMRWQQPSRSPSSSSWLGLSVATCKMLINNVETDGAGDLLGQRTQELIGAMGTNPSLFVTEACSHPSVGPSAPNSWRLLEF